MWQVNAINPPTTPWKLNPISESWPPFMGLRDHTHWTHDSRQDSSGRVISSTQRHLPDNAQHLEETNIHSPGRARTHNSRNGGPYSARPLGLAGVINGVLSNCYLVQSNWWKKERLNVWILLKLWTCVIGLSTEDASWFQNHFIGWLFVINVMTMSGKDSKHIFTI